LRAIWRESVLATVRDAAPQTMVELPQRLLDDDPFDEDAVRAQMRALAALGRAADVTRTYRSFAERVAEELGVDVAIETRNLASELQLEAPSAHRGARSRLARGSQFLEQQGDPAVALRLIACADAHRTSPATLIARYRDTTDRLRKRLDPAVAAAVEASGAEVSLIAGLEELEHALCARG